VKTRPINSPHAENYARKAKSKKKERELGNHNGFLDERQKSIYRVGEKIATHRPKNRKPTIPVGGARPEKKKGGRKRENLVLLLLFERARGLLENEQRKRKVVGGRPRRAGGTKGSGKLKTQAL